MAQPSELTLTEQCTQTWSTDSLQYIGVYHNTSKISEAAVVQPSVLAGLLGPGFSAIEECAKYVSLIPRVFSHDSCSFCYHLYLQREGVRDDGR